MSTTEVRSVTHAWQEYCCVVVWHGVEVEVENMDRPCDPANCLLDVMTNYGEPTGFLFCSWCVGVADDPHLDAEQLRRAEEFHDHYRNLGMSPKGYDLVSPFGADGVAVRDDTRPRRRYNTELTGGRGE